MNCTNCGIESKCLSDYPGHGAVCPDCWNTLASADIRKSEQASADAYIEALRHIYQTEEGK